MPTETTFADFLGRIRAGDEQAAAELIRRYEPFIRREVRMRLTDPTLYRLFDSVDICQSVLLSFFVRAAAGQYDLHEPEDLLNLLITMARNKLASQARKLRTRPADHHRVPAGSQEKLAAAIDLAPSPSQVVSARDLLREVLDRLTDEERRMADLRARGRTWPEITREVGGNAEARRKQLARALDRVTRQLGLDDDPKPGDG
jgi:RNA polymerase sigma-70 factor (ECF subfamily)